MDTNFHISKKSISGQFIYTKPNFNYTDIEDAHDRIQASVLKTPLVVSEYINYLTNANVFFKLENLQPLLHTIE